MSSSVLHIQFVFLSSIICESLDNSPNLLDFSHKACFGQLVAKA